MSIAKRIKETIKDGIDGERPDIMVAEYESKKGEDLIDIDCFVRRESITLNREQSAKIWPILKKFAESKA